MTEFTLGTVEATEQLLQDLYVSLRRKTMQWSLITKQTPQARMGYVGQHLVSVVTGFEGGRSGARGHDLVLPGDAFAEIKTCYRVDQLGKCLACSKPVASVEIECPWCGSVEIKRNDDSKWLLTPRSEGDLLDAFDATSFYLVLFDFVDLHDPQRIVARIWSVDPRSKGFAYLLIDYFFNIRANSNSAAPFNLWPFSLKFHTLTGAQIFEAEITETDEIITKQFPGRDDPVSITLGPLPSYSAARNLTVARANYLASLLSVSVPATATKSQILGDIETARTNGEFTDVALTNAMAEALYHDLVAPHLHLVPQILSEPK